MAQHERKTNFMKGKDWLLVIIALFASYMTYSGLNNMIRSRREQQKWTTDDRELLVYNCFNETGTGVKYPEVTAVYCRCSSDKLMKRFTKPEYLQLTKLPVERQLKNTVPIVQDCLTEYQNAIRQAGK